MCRAMRARQWRRSTRHWRRARCAKKVCALRRRVRCSMRPTISLNRRATVLIRARWHAIWVPRCRRARCSPVAPGISSRGSACIRRCLEGVEIQVLVWLRSGRAGDRCRDGTGAGNPGRPHIAVEGDGSLMFNIQELETVVRHKMQMVLVVWNDCGYGAEVHKLVAKGFNEKLAQWRSPDFVALAKAFGGDGVLLKDPGGIGGAIAEGLRKGGLYLIDARVSPSTPTEPYAKVHFGRESHAPLLRPAR